MLKTTVHWSAGIQIYGESSVCFFSGLAFLWIMSSSFPRLLRLKKKGTKVGLIMCEPREEAATFCGCILSSVLISPCALLGCSSNVVGLTQSNSCWQSWPSWQLSGVVNITAKSGSRFSTAVTPTHCSFALLRIILGFKHVFHLTLKWPHVQWILDERTSYLIHFKRLVLPFK